MAVVDRFRCCVRNLSFLVTAQQIYDGLDVHGLKNECVRVQIVRTGQYRPDRMCSAFLSFKTEGSLNNAIVKLHGLRMCSKFPLEVSRANARQTHPESKRPPPAAAGPCWNGGDNNGGGSSGSRVILPTTLFL